MNREQAIDVIWSMVLCMAPVGADMPNTDTDQATAKTMFGAVALALQTLGVTGGEIAEAQRRWEQNVCGREPQPSDGPEYHADHAAWERRQKIGRGKDGRD